MFELQSVFNRLAVVCGRGPVKIVKIEPDTKINGAYYHSLLKKMFGPGGWLHKFYSEEEMKKVFLHHDKASSHTCREVEKYLSTMSKKLGFRWVHKDDIPVKGCDISPLDFCCFGKMKNALKTRRPRTLGLGARGV